MTVYARQINPAWQEPQLYNIQPADWPETISTFGNNGYMEHIPDAVREVLDALENGDAANILENMGDYSDVYTSAADVLEDFFGAGYDHEKEDRLKSAVKHYGKHGRVYDMRYLCDALRAVTGHAWEYTQIIGDCQGEWQDVVYDTMDWTADDVTRFEVEYFNMGSEWCIHDGAKRPNSADEIEGYCVYCHSNNARSIKGELADIAGCDPQDVKLYAWDGYVQTPKYKEL